MKKILLAVAMVATISASAQMTGNVIYEEKITLDFGSKLDGAEGMPEAQRDQIMAMLEKMKTQTSKKELVFSPEACIYRNYEGKSGEQEVEGGDDNVRVQMVMAKPEQVVYRDIKGKTMVDQTDFMGKTFLIEEKTKSLPWKILKESKNIAGYNCQKAMMINKDREEADTVYAWFTTQIPVPAGPMVYGQLPGMILGISQQGGSLNLEAVEVNLADVDKRHFTAPSKGKKVSRQEFKEIMDEKMKEMEHFQGGQGGKRIEIRME